MIILDTNFLIYMMKYKLAHQLDDRKKELAIPEQVITELETISTGREKMPDREAAKLALVLIEKWNIKLLKKDGSADDAILNLAVENGAKVGTLDRLLIKKLRAKKIKVMIIRQKKIIVED